MYVRAMKGVSHGILEKVREEHITHTGGTEGWMVRAAGSSRTKRGVPGKGVRGKTEHSTRSWREHVTYRGAQELKCDGALGAVRLWRQTGPCREWGAKEAGVRNVTWSHFVAVNVWPAG